MEKTIEILKGIIQREGVEITRNPQRFEALVKDFLWEDRREANLLALALRAGIPDRLLKVSSQANTDLFLQSQVKYLEEDHSLSPQQAQNAVFVWATVLGLSSILLKKTSSASVCNPSSAPSTQTVSIVAVQQVILPARQNAKGTPASFRSLIFLIIICCLGLAYWSHKPRSLTAQQEVLNQNQLPQVSINTVETDLIRLLQDPKTTVEQVKAALKAGVDVNNCDEDGVSPLMVAARNISDPEIIKTLASAGAKINAWTKYGWNALMLAAKYNSNSKIIDALLRAGAVTTTRHKYGWNALMQASWHNSNAEVAKVLLDAGVDVNAVDKEDWSALMFAAQSNPSAQVVKLLLKSGADLNAKNKNGLDALILATLSKESSPEIIEILLNSGANPMLRDSWGNTALDYAEKNETLKYTEVLKRLRAASKK